MNIRYGTDKIVPRRALPGTLNVYIIHQLKINFNVLFDILMV